MATWAQTNLCVPGDIEDEIGDASIVAKVQALDRGTLLQKCIDKAKELIGSKLTSRLPDIYAQSGPVLSSFDLWLAERGYAYDQLDQVLDKIKNPSALKLAAAACTVLVLTRRQIFQDRANAPQLEQEIRMLEKTDWKAEYKERLEDAIHQLKLDLNDDGVVSEHERVRTRNSIQRL